MPQIAVAAAIAVGSAVAGRLASAGDRAKADNAMQQAYNEIMQVGAPPDLSREIIREKLKSVGVYTPHLEDAIEQDLTKFSQIQEDPKLRDAQTRALQSLEQRGATGLTPVERAAFNENRRNVGRESEAKRQQIIQNLASRGMGGSGAELATQLSSAQAGDERLSEEGDRLAAAASQNALQAMSQAGQLGGQIRGQDYQISSDKARAEDELNRFNVSNQIARQQRNIASQNQAQMANLSEQQRISDYNTQQTNSERLRQEEARRQYWQDRMNSAGMRSNALSGQANQAMKNAQDTQDTFQKVGSGVAGGINAYSANQQQQGNFDKYLNAMKPSGTPSQFAPVQMPNVEFGESSNKKNWWD